MRPYGWRQRRRCLHTSRGCSPWKFNGLWPQGNEASQTTKEEARSEAAALLERRMAAMEAVLAARRAAPMQAAEPEMARGPGADLRFSVCCHCIPLENLLHTARHRTLDAVCWPFPRRFRRSTACCPAGCPRTQHH